jgi:hypothetical protein
VQAEVKLSLPGRETLLGRGIRRLQFAVVAG